MGFKLLLLSLFGAVGATAASHECTSPMNHAPMPHDGTSMEMPMEPVIRVVFQSDLSAPPLQIARIEGAARYIGWESIRNSSALIGEWPVGTYVGSRQNMGDIDHWEARFVDMIVLTVLGHSAHGHGSPYPYAATYASFDSQENYHSVRELVCKVL